MTELSGATVVTHSIEPYVLPTWHKLPVVPVTTAAEPQRITHTQFAQHIHFLTGRAPPAGVIDYPDIEHAFRNLVLLEDHVHAPGEDTFPVEVLDVRTYVEPDVFWFSPYSVNTSVYNYSWTNGFKIETAEIDGVTIPIPNPTFSLKQNNSQYLQGTVPIRKIRAYIPSTDANNQLLVTSRVDLIPPVQPVSITLRESSRNVLPVFDTRNTIAPPIELPGFQRTPRFASTFDAFTTSSWKSSDEPPLTDNSLLIWSSYRYTSDSNILTDRNVHMYCSLRPMFGLTVPLERTHHVRPPCHGRARVRQLGATSFDDAHTVAAKFEKMTI